MVNDKLPTFYLKGVLYGQLMVNDNLTIFLRGVCYMDSIW